MTELYALGNISDTRSFECMQLIKILYYTIDCTIDNHTIYRCNYSADNGFISYNVYDIPSYMGITVEYINSFIPWYLTRFYDMTYQMFYDKINNILLSLKDDIISNNIISIMHSSPIEDINNLIINKIKNIFDVDEKQKILSSRKKFYT